MIFPINCHTSLTVHYCFIVSEPIKGAAPPAFNRTLERVELKQASNNPPLQATFKQSHPQHSTNNIPIAVMVAGLLVREMLFRGLVAVQK